MLRRGIQTCIKHHMNQQLTEITEKIVPILREHNVVRAGLFGSVVRGENVSDSDIDLLVDIGPRISLLEFIGLKQQLEDVLMSSVDLVQYKTIKPALKKHILEEEVRIL